MEHKITKDDVETLMGHGKLHLPNDDWLIFYYNTIECPTCEGKGEVRERDGSRFRGDGHLHMNKCKPCNGTGRVPKTYRISCPKCKETRDMAFDGNWQCTVCGYEFSGNPPHMIKEVPKPHQCDKCYWIRSEIETILGMGYNEEEMIERLNVLKNDIAPKPQGGK